MLAVVLDMAVPELLEGCIAVMINGFHTNLSMQKSEDSEVDRSPLQKRAEFGNTSHPSQPYHHLRIGFESRENTGVLQSLEFDLEGGGGRLLFVSFQVEILEDERFTEIASTRKPNDNHKHSEKQKRSVLSIP